MLKPALFVRSRLFPLQVSQFFMYELHVNRAARVKYGVDDVLFESTGNIVFPNYRAVRELAYAMNNIRSVLDAPERQVRSGELNAAGLLDEINHFLVRVYEEHENPGVLRRAYRHLEKQLGKQEFEKILKLFLEEFPPQNVYRQKETSDEYLAGSTGGRSNTEITLEELTMVYLANLNPAMKTIKELFDDGGIAAASDYYQAFSELDNFFRNEKPFGPERQPLLLALRAPALNHPENIGAQIGFLKRMWGLILTSKFLDRIEGGLSFIKEEEQFLWQTKHPFEGPSSAETIVPEYKPAGSLTEEEKQRLRSSGGVRPEDFVYDEPQRFTQDTDWMPNVVIIAKNTYVWLDQLSKKYARPIKRLDEIPDEELDLLARWHFTGLWLIGVWERSSASKRIKQINGNSDAVSSAYSLYDYEIANDIGGEQAFQNLNHRAGERGIRLAGDMVPNHMGLYSKWVIEHPEYFMQSEHPPYPNYRFTGHNLSEHPDIELRIEDGYWSRSDAAVVFQRVDRRTGEARYFFHGNDGTSMPWNDTAQLNLLRADVREAIIQNILHVARKFSIIRFDAAMTLAKKHYQRLWFPMPGTSGVPSRQDNGLSRSEFDNLFPKEFWREVVDRFNAEMPQTLLLAEAFWLMEGYFVRTLGMHRVYNSAFMHMLMKEENGKYRALLRNTLKFNPEILKRYVNFMSNPDEQTAIEQFGRDDKYFGVATMMVTLPGLPMFAHGQIEGYKEKYGMEYQRAYYNETPDYWLVRRHEEEVFPLLRKRYLFSQVRNFELFDFMDDRGFVNENVFAYTNRSGDERALILFHNTFAECNGRIHYSLQKAESEGGSARSIPLAHALNLNTGDRIYYKFRERKSGMQFLVAGKTIADDGWRMYLRAFQYAVFTDFTELYDESGDLKLISDRLNCEGTESVDRLLRQLQLLPLHESVLAAFVDVEPSGGEHFERLVTKALAEAAPFIGAEFVPADHTDEILRTLRCFELLQKSDSLRGSSLRTIAAQKPVRSVIALFQFIVRCHTQVRKARPLLTINDVMNEWDLHSIVEKLCRHWNTFAGNELMTPAMFSVLLRHHAHSDLPSMTDAALIESLLNDFETADFLGVNQHEDVWYYNKEKFERLMVWVKMIQFLSANSGLITSNPFERIVRRFVSAVEQWERVSAGSGYQIEKLKDAVISFSSGTEKTVRAGRKPGAKKKTQPPGTKKRRKSSNVKNITRGRSPS